MTSGIVCISHKEDVDGLSSAALIRSAFKNVRIILVDYANLISGLEKLLENASNSKLKKLFICDLGLSKKTEKKFSEVMGKMISLGVDIIYFDHHDLSPEIEVKLKECGVTLVHSIDECTAVQIYSKYKRRFSSHATFLAASAALTDYMENKPIAMSLISRFDRQFVMLEATALSYMISSSQNDDDFLVNIVENLSDMKYPHQIEGGFAIAEKYANKVAQSIKSIQDSIVKGDNLAYAEISDSSASMVVNFVLGLSGKRAALAYKLKDDISSYILSIRGSKDCKVHLGRLVNNLAMQVGGSGGGHDRACGAMIPKDKLEIFISSLDKEIS